MPIAPPTVVASEVPPFVQRHVGPSGDDVAAMLRVVGYETLEGLVDAAVPAPLRSLAEWELTPAAGESGVVEELRELAGRNTVVRSMIGLGYYGTITPAVIRRNVLESPAWYTAYTPYQPEISQGRLEALLTFQTMVSDLTALPVAGASMLDEATAAAEAMTLMRRAGRAAADAVLLADRQLFPQTLAVLATRAAPLGIEIVTADLREVGDAAGWEAVSRGRPVFGVLLQYPDAAGQVQHWQQLTDLAHGAGAMVAVVADLLALTLLQPPGEWGADVAAGSTQRFGVPLGFGGPHAAYLAVRAGLERSLPGRLVGVSKDAAGAQAYRLALQTREQHIRREKATSNICTAQVLLAVMAGLYAVWHGPEGLTRIARRIHRRAVDVADALSDAGFELASRAFWDTVRVAVPGRADEIVARCLAHGVNICRVDADTVSVSVDQTTSAADVEAVLAGFGASPGRASGDDAADPCRWPEDLTRRSGFLTHPVFHEHRSETAMLRYLRRLADRDYALDRGMIPLGSCTMKLNATTLMEPITWPQFAHLHPFAPAEQSEGLRELIAQLEEALARITGYAAVSLQPNAGSQGEFAGLLAIHAYHRARGEGHRRVCLIPASAHGTNAASAVMAGLRVVVVATGPDGDVDMTDLREKVASHRENLAAIMVTYPSTHGVFEDTITTLCDLVHDAGGQVYVDGANLNALIGLAQPGRFGADVSHLNLHKTFCIPHGGGGPGVGPVAVRSHLAPYLPNHPLDPTAGPPTGVGPVAAAPFGSAGVLPISWSYIRLMGSAGLAYATEVAILSANYVASRLGQAYPVLYAGRNGLVAHECILDLRPLTRATGVSVEDVAKRLIDYGFHAPTVSFPVAGTLMVEPTESEDRRELDRFCDAMLAIRDEIAAIERGEVDVADSVLRHAPHSATALTEDWRHGYSRTEAVFPAGVDPSAKYWPPVRRIDGPYGDRHLVCSCPPVAAFAD